MQASTTAHERVDLAAVKARQRLVWASGDYGAVAARIQLIAERLADAADLDAGSRVLDVATGTGNAAIAAARGDCEVVGVDYVPELLERARLRADAERLEVDFREGDAEALPFGDDAFDAVLSSVGVMFAPDQERAAGELVRVCRPGGTIALASWTPDGFIGEMLRTVSRHVPPPAGMRTPVEWGTQARLEELFDGAAAELTAERRTFTFRYRSPEHFVDFFRSHYGPTLKAFDALDTRGREGLAGDLAALVRRFDGGGGSAVSIRSDYLEAVVVLDGTAG